MTARQVGSDFYDFLGQQLMLDLLDQQDGQPDHWVLVTLLMQRLRLRDIVAVFLALRRMRGQGWIETDTTFQDNVRARLSPAGVALLTRPYAKRARVPQQKPRTTRRGLVRRRLSTRQL